MKKISKIILRIGEILFLFMIGYQFLRSNNYIGSTKLDNILNNKDSSTIKNETSSNLIDYSNTKITFEDTLNHTISVPQFDGKTYSIEINNNQPYFTDNDLLSTKTWHTFSDLDQWGRVGVANAVVGPETLQTNARGSLSEFSPSGWYGCKASLGGGNNAGQTRCERSHLIANKLLGDVSDDEHNLVTGTHDFNANSNSGMLHWERMVMDAAENGYHIRYRVTPVFDEKNSKVAGSVTPHGVLMEAESIEDKGETVKLCVYVYNTEAGWTCDYVNGDWELIQR